MALQEPGISELESRVVELLKETELASFATVSEDNKPHASCMHIVSDGTTVYFHTYIYTRKYEHLLQNPAISFELHRLISGFEDRMNLRAIQMSGKATKVVDQEELDRVLALSYEKHDWLREFDMYAVFKRETKEMRQVFFRVDPFDALYSDNTVRFGWRKSLTFDGNGKVAEVEGYRGDVRGT
ncbi:pyridoxamine 5'-phosphate oxidase family protein [Pseudomaricurvus alkylphenolicus]|uniref:pyridoxamine 5'-phosphate oxidase family protein n=1 Tax=Pseudomaricurvus alkylphenolicus TaxID=1306991 RepID=UPI0014235797|nr:pyridoxamine 5'-phosphate oxidase family protein [Pseudomaricurvus alkylphenolicus]NIB38350.1 pyridoxamine 5'-phosphate oxidase family protein [Pseudomaricurvus alkylphenolicus]